ncbi:putative O-glycosylation ligase, exosortase A system-associated [Rhodopila globiformis]|nr:putative O-glycosylation ligase, exosortase A system-associated [Rhodopila globiformis]
MFAAVVMLLVPLGLVSAYTGILAWIWTALLAPNTLLYGFMSGVPFNKIIAIVTLLAVFLGREKKDLYLDKALVFLLLFSVAVTISWLGSLDPSAAGDDLYMKVIKIVVLAFTITAVMTTRHRIELAVLVCAVALGYFGVAEGLFSIASGGGHKILGEASIGDNNQLATALLMVAPLVYYLVLRSELAVIRIGLWVVLGLCVVTIVMTFSRGGFLGLLVLAAYLVKNSRKKFLAVFRVALAGILILTLAPSSWFHRLDTIQTADNDGSFMGRVVAWKMSLLIALDHPFFGGGMHAVQHGPVWTHYAPLLPRVNFVETPPPDVHPHAAHSIYFEVLGDLGFTGLALFLAVLVATLLSCRRIYRMSKGHPSLTWAADLARLLQVSIVVYMVTGAALSMAYFEFGYILIAIVSRCRRTVALALEAQAPDELSLIPNRTDPPWRTPAKATPSKPPRWSDRMPARPARWNSQGTERFPGME